MYKEIQSINDIKGIEAVFDREWKKVLSDIADSGAQFDSKREIQIKIEIAPVDEDKVAVNVTGVTKLGKPINRAFLATLKIEDGDVQIVQQMLFPVEQAGEA